MVPKKSLVITLVHKKGYTRFASEIHITISGLDHEKNMLRTKQTMVFPTERIGQSKLAIVFFSAFINLRILCPCFFQAHKPIINPPIFSGVSQWGDRLASWLTAMVPWNNGNSLGKWCEDVENWCSANVPSKWFNGDLFMGFSWDFSGDNDAKWIQNDANNRTKMMYPLVSSLPWLENPPSMEL